jgi:dephospho-CoA kinase
MTIVGLTGSIGMGKSTTAAMLRRLKIPVFDADAAVHRLMAPQGPAVAAVLEAFPGVGNDKGGIDRKKLGAAVFGDTPALRRLEAILHPRVHAARQDVLRACARRRAPIVVLDVPLLFEGGGDRACDAVLLATTSAMLQRQRVLARPGMTETQFRQILGRQVPDAVKRRRTPYIVETGLGKRYALMRLRDYIRALEIDGKSGSWGRYARNRVRYGNHRARSRQW